MLRVLFIAILCSSFQVSAKVLTLDLLKKNIKKNSFDIKANKENVRSHQLSVKGKRSSLFPKIGIQFESEYQTSNGQEQRDNIQSVYGQINLFNGFKDISAISQAKIQLAISEKSLENNIMLKELLIEKNFYQLLFLRKRYEILRSELNRSIFHISMVKKRLNSKIITETDLLEFKLYRKKLESLLTYTKLESDTIQSQLLAISSLDDDIDYSISGILPHYKVETKLKQLIAMVDKNFGLETQKLKIDHAKESAKTISSDWYPSVDLKLEHGYLDEVETGLDSEQVSSRVVLLASWEFFSGGETDNNYKSEMKRVKSLVYSYKQSKLDYEIKVTRLFNQLKILEKTILSEEENAKLSKDLYRKTLKEYNKGIKDSGALASSSKEMSEAQSRVYQLKFNYVLAKVRLEQATGRRLDFKSVSHNKD